MISLFVFSNYIQTLSFQVNWMSIEDVHHCDCDPNNARDDLVGLRNAPKTNHWSEWSHVLWKNWTCQFNPNHVWFFLGNLLDVIWLKPKHVREETKRLNMRWNSGSTVYFSKAQLNENQCEWTHVVCSDAYWTSWWFQPIWKILVKLDHFPK